MVEVLRSSLCPSCEGPMPAPGAAVACPVCHVRYCSPTCSCPVTFRSGQHEHRILRHLAELEESYEARTES